MKAEKLFEPQGGPIIMSQVIEKTLNLVLIIFFCIMNNFCLGLVSCIFWATTLKRVFSEFSADREWVWTYWVGNWSTGESLYKMGSTNGSGSWHWSPMDYVQARGCSWPNCKINLIFLLSIFLFHFLRICRLFLWFCSMFLSFLFWGLGCALIFSYSFSWDPSNLFSVVFSSIFRC